ncbi:MAG: VPLPA-CTERM sorting domain-containing protein [Pseudomonadota bacterium]
MLSNLSKAFLGCLLIGASATGANALTIGGFDFDDNAGVDQLNASSPANTFRIGISTATSVDEVESVLTDNSQNTTATLFNSSAFVELAFVDNVLVNAPGIDLVIFETGFSIGGTDFVNVTINGTTFAGQGVDTGEFAGGFQLNQISIELSNFGILEGGEVSSVRLGTALGDLPTIAFVGALNSTEIPLPAPVFLLLAGLAGLGLAARKHARSD